MDEEVKALKARLKAAGVNRTVAGINAAEEEEYYDEEDEDEEKDAGSAKKVASPEKEENHVPKVAGSSMTDFKKAGIPRPPVHNNLINPSEFGATNSAMNNSARDFRIVANSSKTSFGAESNTAKPINRLPKQRPNLMGAGKPHMLKNQNDQIRAMLGGKDQPPSTLGTKTTLEPID